MEAEIESFIVKFKQLWKAGHTAHLDMDVCAGQAWIGLKMQLGNSEQLYHAKPKSSARERRRMKRASMSKNIPTSVASQSEEGVPFNHATENVVPEPLVKVTTESVVLEASDVAATENVVLEVDDNIEQVDDEMKVHESFTEENHEQDEVDGGENAEIPFPKVDNDSRTALIYGTVVFDNSPSHKLQQQNIDKLGNIIRSKDHLPKNIVTISFGDHRSWTLQDSRFKHEIPIMFRVNTSNLWQSARTYIWKHLGTSTWNLQDGTRISLVRIHHK